jgi:DNA-binding Xre family transcriptional regulator
MDVIATIDRILSERGMRRMDLATLLGWSQSKLSKTMGEPEKMTLGEVTLIAKALKVRPSALILDDADRQPAMTEMERELLTAIRNVGTGEVLTRLIKTGALLPTPDPALPEPRKPEGAFVHRDGGGTFVKRDARKGRKIGQPAKNAPQVTRADIIVEGPELDESKQRANRKRG